MEEVRGPKLDSDEKQTSFGHIPWENLGLPMNFSADPHMYV